MHLQRKIKPISLLGFILSSLMTAQPELEAGCGSSSPVCDPTDASRWRGPPGESPSEARLKFQIQVLEKDRIGCRHAKCRQKIEEELILLRIKYHFAEVRLLDAEK